MAKRKTIKRNIHIICTDLWAECVATMLYSTKANENNVEALLHSIINLEHDFVSRVSHVEPGIAPKAYFKDLIDKFNSQSSEIIDQINNLH